MYNVRIDWNQLNQTTDLFLKYTCFLKIIPRFSDVIRVELEDFDFDSIKVSLYIHFTYNTKMNVV